MPCSFLYEDGMTHKSNFNFEVLKELRREMDEKGNGGTVLQVVKWERADCPVLERRRIYITRKGELRFRKLVGMNAADIQLVVEHADEIAPLLVKEESHE